MPKFIWVGEIIEGNKFSANQIVKSIIVVDATESGLTDHLIFATNSRYLIIKNSNIFSDNNNYEDFHKKYHIFDIGNEIFHTFKNNLKGKHTKWQN